MKFIHTTDLHANKERKDGCLKVLSTIYDYIDNEKDKPILLISGDFWNASISNTESSGFVEFVEAVKKITKITKVIFITGTSSHEPYGSVSVFRSIGADVFDEMSVKDYGDFEIIAIPEPRKADFPANSAEEIVDKINKSIKDFISNIPSKTKPRVVMYHGEVSGAVYDNGMNASSPTAIPQKLLKTLNADYYALGHIHFPQTLFENCCYAGSPYPVNFGERHNGCFNVVTIDSKTNVEKISLGFPINITEYANIEDLDEILKRDYSGKRVHLKLTISKLLKKSFNQDQIAKQIKDSTKADFVKISFDYKAITNIRSEEIAKEQSVTEKFKIYADINDIKITDEMIQKIEQIQDELLIDRFVPCDTFELEYLSLRGAIGIKDGTGLDEINIDFTKYHNGILALTAENGKGKTTILENCHPFPQMLTRSGSLKDHFCLKDSHRILIYKTSKGRIKISMFIDGAAKCIGTRYLVEIEQDGVWTPYRAVDGSFDSYKDFVSTTFGSVEMFLRTSFYTKEQAKGVPDLARATKSEKMELFSLLAGIEYLSQISELAKTKKEDIEDKIKDVKSTVKDFDNIVEKIKTDKTLIENNNIELEKQNKLNEEDKKKLAELEEIQAIYLKAVGSYDILRRNLVKDRNSLEETEREIDSTQEQIKGLKEQQKNIEFYRKQVEWWNSTSSQENELRVEKDKLSSEIMGLSDQKTGLYLKNQSLTAQKDNKEKELIKLQTKLENLEKNIIKEQDVCPVCGAPLSEHKKEELEAERNKQLNAIKDLKKEIADKDNEISPLTEDIDYNKGTLSEIDGIIENKQTRIGEILDDLEQIKEYRESVNIEEARFVLEKIEPTLKDYEEKLKKAKDKKKCLECDIREAEEGMKNIPPDKTDEINKLKNANSTTISEIARLTSEISFAEKELESLKEQEELIKGVSDILAQHNKDLKEYMIIQKAFSNTGIQVLELDSTAPEVSIVANNILSETYGDRFTISFDTQRDSSDGKKLIDDFIINVFDSESGRVKTLDLLSSGERVWIRQALYYAFSVIRSRRTGFCFRTRFLDESDGSLDSQARVKYIKMIESAHRMSNATLTLLVTHSQEVKDVVDQKIEL